MGSAVRTLHRFSHRRGDRQRFGGQHRRLVGDADSAQIPFGIETGRAGVRRITRHELLCRSSALNVRHYILGFRHVAHDQVVAAGIAKDLRRRRPRLLMVVLAVDERRESITPIAVHTLPYVQNRPTGRIDENTSDRSQRLEIPDRHPERGEDHHVIGRYRRVVESLGAGHENLHPHSAQLLVHVGIVNDLTHQHDPPIGEFGARLICVIHGALHPVTEPEFLGEANRDPFHRERVLPLEQQVHQARRIVGGQCLLHGGLEPKAFAEVRVVWRHG